MKERRVQVRVRAPVLIEFPNPSTLKTERSYTSDISETGLRFPSEVAVPIGHELALSLELPFERAVFHATGEVVWVREIARHGGPQYEIGLRFRWLQDPDHDRLGRYLLAMSTGKL